MVLNVPDPDVLFSQWQAAYGTPAGDTLAACWECSRAYWGSYYGRKQDDQCADVGRALQHCGLCPEAWAGVVLKAAGGTGYELPPQAEPVGGWGDRYLFHPDPNAPIPIPTPSDGTNQTFTLGTSVLLPVLLVAAVAFFALRSKKRRN